MKMRTRLARPLSSFLVLVLALGGTGAIAAGTASAANPPVSLSPSSGPAGTSITVTLPSACGSPSGASTLSVVLSPVAGGAGGNAVSVPVASGATVSQTVVGVPLSAHAGSDWVQGSCAGPAGTTTYGRATFTVTGGPALPALTVAPTSGPPGSTIDVSGACAPGSAQPSATFGVTLFSLVEPDRTVYRSATGAGPTLATTIPVPTDFPVGPARIAASCSDYLSTSAFAEATFSVTGSPGSITSTGPLTQIGVGTTLDCSANHVGDSAGEFFGDTSCGTFGLVDGTVYGPFNLGSSSAVWTPLSQTGPTGSGTAADPYTITTVVTAGTTGVEVTQTDTYTTGLESFRTDVAVRNTSGVAKDVRVYRAADCYLQDSDSGYGAVDTATGAVACTTGLAPGARIEQWFPITPGSHYYEDHYSSVYSRIGSQQPFPDTCGCATLQDNGAGLSWDAAIAAGQSRTFSSFITFSPLGILPLSLAVTADAGTVPVNGTAGYTITVTNPNPAAVTLASLADALPATFGYVAGSTTGLTTADPTVGSGNTLTWTGPLVVPGSGTASLHFGAAVGTTTGSFPSSVTATNDDGYTVAPTGPDAPVTVTSGPGGLALTLAPATTTRTLGDAAPVLTAHAARGAAAQSGVTVTFTVTSGPDAGVTATGVTDASGDATFSAPTSEVTGTDVVHASAPDGAASVTSNDAAITWNAATSGGFSVTGGASPATVTTGSSTLAHFVITNPGADALTGVAATVTLSAGGVGVSATASPGGCTAFNGPMTACVIGTIAAGGSATVDVVASTGDLPAGAQVTASIEVQADGHEPVPADASADVVQPAVGEATGYVPPGGTISTGSTATPENNTVASLRLPTYGPGAPITLRAETEGVETFCGGKACSGKILFVSPFEGYTDPRRPVRLKITWDRTVAGRGTKGTLYVQKAPGGPITTVPKCDRTSKHIAIPSPCIHKKSRLRHGDIQYEVLLLSGDPRFSRR